MIQIRSLVNIDREELFRAFQQAFQDYEFQWSKSQFQNMLLRRGYQAELSFGAFAEEQLVSFILNGIAIYEGKHSAYDTATGTIPEFRGQQLISRIFNFSLAPLKKAGIEVYRLEVLSSNKKALKIYQQQGFETIRELNYYQNRSSHCLTDHQQAEGINIETITTSTALKADDFMDVVPSWQNYAASIHRMADSFCCFGAFRAKTLLGYIILQPHEGDIAQIAVKPNERRKGIGTMLMETAVNANKFVTFKLTNVPVDCDSMNHFLNFHGIKPLGTQKEMLLQFNKEH